MEQCNAYQLLPNVPRNLSSCLDWHADDTTSATGADADFISSFCLEHRGKTLVVVSETHQIVEEGHEWAN